MEFEAFKLCVIGTFSACLFSVTLARMELQPASPSPEVGHTPQLERIFGDQQPWCPKGWYLYPGTNSCFGTPQRAYRSLKHTAAQESCRAEGGALATVSRQELEHVMKRQRPRLDARNHTLVLWVGYVLVRVEGNDPEGRNGSNSIITWQVRTEEATTGPEPLLDNSANIPTSVPEELKRERVVCIQLKLVYVDGILARSYWNLARCNDSVPFICKKGASQSCYDWKNRLIPEGQSFTPPGRDSCTVCTCLQGVPNICSIANCAPPACQNYQPKPDKCCQYTCLDNGDPNMPPNGGDSSDAIMSENMRWVLTMITSFLLLIMMLFMVYRMRQKRIAYLRYQVQQLRDGQEGEFEPGSGPPPAPAVDEADGHIFREPPPPYSFFKDNNCIEMPPPYHVQQNTAQRICRQDVNHNRDSRGSDQPDNVMLLTGSEPTTPSDISTISTLASPPPYNHCQSVESAPMTPPESTPMLRPINTRHSSQPSSSSSGQLIRNTTV
ncbi:integral membrane protein DGCR2/IDD-like [Diadema antillarum]|uniref:integral membrane protein DGCR2/IDD-like n=1 Tax=Diadema antillarum TaxID=105358 RepID=UPI003A8A2561